jgi:hypothetical protein
MYIAWASYKIQNRVGMDYGSAHYETFDFKTPEGLESPTPISTDSLVAYFCSFFFLQNCLFAPLSNSIWPGS